MKKTVCIKALVAGLFISSGAVIAQDAPTLKSLVSGTQDPILDYRIGKSTNYSFRGRPDFSFGTPGLDMSFSANCSGWDVGVSIEGLMKDTKSKFNQVQRNVVNGVQGFVTQLPMLLLQRYDPALYEMLNNALIEAEELFDIEVSNCRKMTERFKKDGWGAVADTSFYMSLTGEAESKDGKSINTVMDSIDKDPGKDGVRTIEGDKCGGEDQPMCETVKSAVNEGFDNISQGQTPPPKNTSDKDTKDVWLWRVWRSGEEAGDWIKKVVGDVKYAVCDNCKKLVTTPGMGTYDEVANEAEALGLKLFDLANNDEGIPRREQLYEVSASDYLIDENVIAALRAEDVHRGLFITRVAEDIALMRVVDKLLAARRVLIAGKSNPNFATVTKNVEVIDSKISMVSDEIKMLKEEIELKRAARGDTVVTLLTRHQVRKLRRVQDNSSSELLNIQNDMRGN